jgi:Family of unknown function (DUF5906)
MRLYDDLPDLYPAGHANKLKAIEMCLGTLCAITNNGGWLVKHRTGAWEEYSSRKAAHLALCQNWDGRNTPHNLTAKDIADFMSGDAPVVRGGMSVPTSPDVLGIRFEDRVYVNTWRDTIIGPNADAMHDLVLREPLTLLFRMLREGLCGKDDALTLEEMLAISQGDDPSEIEFRFLMSWLSAPIQSPGRNLQTNCWLLGELGGVGKGLLCGTIMPHIYGRQNSVMLDAAEVEQGGWTDALAGKLWIVINELDASRRKVNWNSFIKAMSCEPVVPIRKRGVHSFQALNFGNWAFTTNDENPACLDAFDRRNTLIAATNRAEKATLALDLYHWMKAHEDEVAKMLGGFVFLLRRHRVDEKLIERAPDTLIKLDVQEATSKDIEGAFWLRNDDDYPRDQWQRANDFLPDYSRFMRPEKPITPRVMGGIMAKLARKKFVEMRRKSKTHAAEYMVPSERFPTQRDEARAAANGTTSTKLALVPRAK